MPRAPKLFTLDTELITALEKRSKEIDEPMSRLVDQGLRLLLALPAPVAAEKPEKTASDLAPTRSELTALEALRALGPGGHLTTEIARATGISRGVVVKALRAAVARGEAFLWGTGTVSYEGNPFLAWGVRSPLDVIRDLVKEAQQSRPANPIGGVLDEMVRIRWQSFMIDDVQPVRELVGAALGLPATKDALGIWSEPECREKRAEIEKRRAKDEEVEEDEYPRDQDYKQWIIGGAIPDAARWPASAESDAFEW